MTSKETVILFGDPTDPIILECKAKLEAAGRNVEISKEPFDKIIDLNTWTESK